MHRISVRRSPKVEHRHVSSRKAKESSLTVVTCIVCQDTIGVVIDGWHVEGSRL